MPARREDIEWSRTSQCGRRRWRRAGVAMSDRLVANALAFLSGACVLFTAHDALLASTYSALALMLALCAPRVGDWLGGLMWQVATHDR